MHFYKATCETYPGAFTFFGSLTLAHIGSRQMFIEQRNWLDVRIELFEIDTAKESMLNMLNTPNGDGETMGTVLRTWGLTPRGGLRELKNGE